MTDSRKCWLHLVPSLLSQTPGRRVCYPALSLSLLMETHMSDGPLQEIVDLALSLIKYSRKNGLGVSHCQSIVKQPKNRSPSR